MADYIPGPDANFQAWQSTIVTYTNAPCVMTFPSEDGGKTSFAWMSWVSLTGEHGPWGEQAQATIAAKCAAARFQRRIAGN